MVHSSARAFKTVLAAAAWIIISAGACWAADIKCGAKYGGHPNSAYVNEVKRLGVDYPNEGTCEIALITGEIQKGDFERFSAFIQQQTEYLDAVVIGSPGGNVEEALKIGSLIRRLLYRTMVPEQYPVGAGWPFELALGAVVAKEPEPQCLKDICLCASACALIWLGGIERSPGIVGIHRPTLPDHELGRMDIEDAGRSYKEVIAGTNGYLDEMDVPPRLKQLFVSTSSGEIYYMSENDFQESRSLNGREYVPAVEEWLTSACGRVTDEERRMTDILRDKRNATGGGLSEAEMMLLKKLDQERSDIYHCRKWSLVKQRKGLLRQ
jgi:hypothetical protein